VISPRLAEEKHAALMTNEIQVNSPFLKLDNITPQIKDEEEENVGEEEEDDSDSSEYVNDQPIEDDSASSAQSFM